MTDPAPRKSAAVPPPLPPRRRKRRFRDRIRGFFGKFKNDLLGWEVLRAGRRTGTLAIGRTAIGGLLLAAMWALWAANSSDLEGSASGSGAIIGKRLTKFAESFALTFFFVQTIAVLLLTPVFVAGAIFEERETRSGEILLTTRLTRREVYVGKVGARMVQVLLVVFASMPILFLTQLWGGVGIEMILVNYLATCLSVIGAGTITAALSAYAESMRSAILRSYGMLFLVDVLFFPASPLLVVSMSALHWGAGAAMLIFFFAFQITIVLVSYFIGQRWLRMAMLRQKTRIVRKPGEKRSSRDRPKLKLPPLGEDADPLIWKELNVGSRVTPKQVMRAWFGFGQRLTADDRMDERGFAHWLAISREQGAIALRICLLFVGLIILVLVIAGGIPGNWLVRYAGGLSLLWLLCSVGLTASNSISRERQKHTLLDLLMLPGPRRDLLRAKAIGALSRALWPAAFIAIILLIGVLSLELSPLAAIALAFATAGFTIFACGLGIWLSARCRSALNSTATFIGALAAVLIGTFLLAEANMEMEGRGTTSSQVYFDYPAWSRLLNPLLSWGRLCFRLDINRLNHFTHENIAEPMTLEDILPAAASPVMFALIGWLLWRLAVRRFEKEGRS